MEDAVNFDMADRHRRFEYLVSGYSSDIYRMAYWLCRNQEIAEDLVQDTFLRAWRALGSLDDESKARSWLVTILRRENARRFERKQLELLDMESHEPALYEDKWPERVIERDDLRKAIGSLPIAYREPLVLQILGGFSCDEIAEIMDVGRGAIMTRLFRAKRKLANTIRQGEKVGVRPIAAIKPTHG